jgi:hypothetical protein
LLIVIICVFFYLNSDRRIQNLLNSNKTDDLILGAYKAGKSEDKKFIPLLLKNAADARTTTNFRFKGFSVYQEKMIALKKIFKTEPPLRIENIPDSNVIKFYTDLYKLNSR